MKRIVGLFLLSLLFSSYVLTSPLPVKGIIHYHDGFLVLTAGSSNNTTQLWFFEPGKGFKLLNATFPTLTFVHSNGEEVLLYQNSSDHHYLQRFHLYVYDGELKSLGDYTEFDEIGMDSRIYWNGEFYLFLEIDWTTQEGSSYNWYAILDSSIYRLFPEEGENRYFSGVWWIPHGYAIIGWDPESYRRELFFVTLQDSHLSLVNLTPANLSVDGLCFNGTHLGTLVSNRFELISDNVSTLRYYLQTISINGEYVLIPIAVFDRKGEKNITIELMGYTDGKWILKKVYSWWDISELKAHHRILGYITVSHKGITELTNKTSFTTVCEMVDPRKVFGWGRPVKMPLELRGKRVVVNGTVLRYGERVLRLPFNPKIADCGNGCLLSDGKELAYFNGGQIGVARFPGKPWKRRGCIFATGALILFVLMVMGWKIVLKKR